MFQVRAVSVENAVEKYPNWRESPLENVLQSLEFLAEVPQVWFQGCETPKHVAPSFPRRFLDQRVQTLTPPATSELAESTLSTSW